MDLNLLSFSRDEDLVLVSRRNNACTNNIKGKKKGLQNRRLSREDARWLKLQSDVDTRMRVAIAREIRWSSRSDEDWEMICASSQYHWRQIICNLLCSYRKRAQWEGWKSICSFMRWRRLVQRILRRQEEQKRFSIEQSLVENMVADSIWLQRQPCLEWSSSRPRQSCVLCSPTSKQRFFYDTRLASFRNSLQNHVEQKHTDMGRLRICSCCKKCCRSEWGCLQHQIEKHILPSVKSLMPREYNVMISQTMISTWKQAERDMVARKAYRSSCYYHLTIAEVRAIMEYRLDGWWALRTQTQELL